LLRTLAEARGYIIAMPKHPALRQHWQHVARLIIEQADVGDLAHYVHLALFLDDQTDRQIGQPGRNRSGIQIRSAKPDQAPVNARAANSARQYW